MAILQLYKAVYYTQLCLPLEMLSGRSPFFEADTLEIESRILAGRYDAFKLYPNVSQSAALFIRKVLSAHPW
ncbi:Striated muscle preferentially expressed protein kinase, partial [Ophiophagus hannah]